ncbi:MAG: RdgB/HAM1 family non-canonical purine NTP pyrophosphatase [Fibrobacteria bacterium]|nr:RdgB/HAM1 family non-canonical purine NTP pyrophosphatase [Fibrobacteria bacterium]
MNKLNRWVFATGNNGKALEMQELLAEQNITVLTLKDIGFAGDIVEDGINFEENARIKVEAVCDTVEHPVFADDSGLEVDALNGEPGLYSARYAGEGASDQANRDKLLNALRDSGNRKARFVCVVACKFPGQEILVFRGICEGSIGLEEKGDHGFGYDPIFIPSGYQESFGELDDKLKSKLSHRGLAMAELKKNIF